MSELIKSINKYFSTFSNKNYTIYVDGTPTEWCGYGSNTYYVAWRIQRKPNELSWYFVDPLNIEAVKLTPTTMKIIKTDGEVHNFVAKLKTKAWLARQYDNVLKCLIKLKNMITDY